MNYWLLIYEHSFKSRSVWLTVSFVHRVIKELCLDYIIYTGVSYEFPKKWHDLEIFSQCLTYLYHFTLKVKGWNESVC